MTDREVGKLWAEIYGDENCITNEGGFCYSDRLCPHHIDYPRVVALIRKLVEERAMAQWIQDDKQKYTKLRDYIPWALRDFGIDPETWEEK